MNLKTKFEVQNAVRSWLGFFMSENNISASVMVDVITSALLELKDAAYFEMIQEMEAQREVAIEAEE